METLYGEKTLKTTLTVTFEANGKKYVNFVINDETAQDLKAQGVDVDALVKKRRKMELSQATDSYIQQKLQEIDEDLADLVSEKSYLEGVFAARGISPEDVRNATVAVVIGQKTVDEAISELSIPEDLISDFKRAVEIAKIIAWKEAIWKAEATLEAQIDSMTLEELLSLDVKKLCQDAYAQIPLEVEGG